MSRKKLVVAGSIFGLALMAAPAAFPAANTSGLAALSLRGVGTGALAAGNCTSPPIPCPGTDVCECLSVSDTVLGSSGFNRGSLTASLSVDTTTALPVTAAGDCLVAAGQGTISSSNGRQQLSIVISGLVCSTLSNFETFNGTYVATGGTGRYANGTGAINGSQVIVGGNTSQVAVTGTIQP